MNSQKVREKQSKMERKLNKLVVYIVIAQAILCVLVVIISSFWYKNAEADYYYLPFNWAVGVQAVIIFFSYFLLLNTMLPISLIISLEIVKVVQSFFIINDAKMFSFERDKKAKVSSTSIIEDLG